jgi:TonB family protein
MPTLSFLHRAPVWLLACAAAASSALAAVTPPKALNKVAPTHPPSLIAEGVEGSAIVQISIDEVGAVTSAVVIEATRPEFGDAAVVAVSQWTFEPARRDGKPMPVQVKQKFSFPVPVEERLKVLAGREVFVAPNAPVYDTADLSRTPKLEAIPTAVYPTQMSGTGQTGKVTVRFLIGPDGKAVNPEIEKTNNEAFNVPAMVALLKAHWEPPREGAQEIYVRTWMTIKVNEVPATASN